MGRSLKMKLVFNCTCCQGVMHLYPPPCSTAVLTCLPHTIPVFGYKSCNIVQHNTMEAASFAKMVFLAKCPVELLHKGITRVAVGKSQSQCLYSKMS